MIKQTFIGNKWFKQTFIGNNAFNKPPEAPVHFNADTAFPTQTFIRQIVKLKTL